MKLKSKILSSLMLVGTCMSFSAHAVVGTEASPNVQFLGTFSGNAGTTYGNFFNAPTATKFFDNYNFNLSSASSLSNITSTISLYNAFNISNLTASLYKGFGPFNGGDMALISSFAIPFSVTPFASGSTASFAMDNLMAGSYTLAINGDVTGTFGGGYGGVMNVAPVPEPETYGMMLLGLGLVGFAARRKAKAKSFAIAA